MLQTTFCCATRFWPPCGAKFDCIDVDVGHTMVAKLFRLPPGTIFGPVNIYCKYMFNSLFFAYLHAYSIAFIYRAHIMSGKVK